MYVVKCYNNLYYPDIFVLLKKFEGKAEFLQHIFRKFIAVNL